jgi:hypothetical protein
VRKFATHRARIAKGFEGVAYLGTAECRIVLHARQPICGPLQGFNQLTRQAKGQIKTTDPRLRLLEPIGEGGQGVKAQQALQVHAASLGVADGNNDGFTLGRAAAEIAAYEVHAK